jgi:hypothetical protein
LANEPFLVTSAELIHGFTACVCVRLKPGVQLRTVTGELWSPLLVIEPSGGANESLPRRQLFTRRKHEYLRHALSVTVQTVPVAVLMAKGRSKLREKILEIPDLFRALYPPTLEDASNFSSTLSSLGLEGLMSSLHSQSQGQRGPAGASSLYFMGSSGTMGGYSGGGSGGEDQNDGSLECCLDFFESPPTLVSPRGLRMSPYQQGMAIGWIGEPPSSAPSLPSHPRSSPSTRCPTVLPSASGISVMPPPSSIKFLAGGVAGATASASEAAQQYSLPAQRSLPLRPLQSGKLTSLGTTASDITSLKVPQSTGELVATVGSVQGELAQPQPQPPAVMDLARVGSLVAGPIRSPNTTRSSPSSPATNPEDVTEEVGEEQHAAVDSEIELLEAQLEIARLEARLLQLRKAKVKSPKSGSASSPENVNSNDNSI